MPQSFPAPFTGHCRIALCRAPPAMKRRWRRFGPGDAQLTKPAGSLGRLEELVEFLARWQGKAPPTLDNPMVAIFAGNHGRHGARCVGLPGGGDGADGRQFHRRRGRDLADLRPARAQSAGVRTGARTADRRYHRRAGDGRQDVCRNDRPMAWRRSPASPTCCAWAKWASAIRRSLRRSTRHSTAAMAADWVGSPVPASTTRGSAARPRRSMRRWPFHHPELVDPLSILARLGGREIAAMLGALIAARHQKIPVIVDGFVATSAAAIAHAVNPRAIDHCLFAHVSAETAHKRVLAALDQTALLDLGMRLGEGSGAATGSGAWPKRRCHLHNNMATFAEAAGQRQGLTARGSAAISAGWRYTRRRSGRSACHRRRRSPPATR